MSKIITGKVRLSYTHLFKPQAGIGGGEAKYSVSLVIPKDDLSTLADVEAAIEKAKQAGVSRYGTKFDQAANFRMPLRDGDIDKANDASYRDSYFLLE